MKKRVFIAHGWGGYPGECWFPWLKQELETAGFSVSVPSLPDTENPRIAGWVSALKAAIGSPDEHTHFVGHSLGCQCIVRYLETLPEGTPVGGVVFVGGFFKRLTGTEPGERKTEEHWLNTPLNFAKVRSHLSGSVAVFSDDDPYVPLDNQDDFRHRLGSTVIVLSGMGHFNDENSRMAELPVVLQSVLQLAS